MTDAIWSVAQPPTELERGELTAYHPVVIQLLINRGIRMVKEAETFFAPDYGRDVHDPFLFRDMEKAVERIQTAKKKGERVVVYGDYDADGVCSTVVLTSFLQELGLNKEHIGVYIPHRATEGYGLNVRTINELAEQKTTLIITCDCGITNVPEIAHAATCGIDVIITDHHLPPRELPHAYAIINPNTPGETYPFTQLSGTGVAFKLVQAFARKGEISTAFEKWLLDLVVIGTVTDFSPLIGENRVFALYGLLTLQKMRRTGIKALLTVMRKQRGTVDTRLIGYGIGPRLNAAGRIDHASLAFKLFGAEDKSEALDYARELDRINSERQRLGEEIATAAIEQSGVEKEIPKIIFAHDPSWPGGVVGAVASRLAHTYYRPTIIVGRQEENLIGSCRSVAGVNITEMIRSVEQAFEQYGGHPMACGFTVKKDYGIDCLKADLMAAAEKIDPSLLVPRERIDAELDLADVKRDLTDMLAKFEPTGEGNPPPRFLLRDVAVTDFRVVGQKSEHLRLVLRGKRSIVRNAIAFGHGAWAERLTIGDQIECIAELGDNEWNGRKEIQLKIIDLRMAHNE